MTSPHPRLAAAPTLPDPLQAQLDARVDVDVFAHCARLAAEVAGLRTAVDFARAMHGGLCAPAPLVPTLDEALRAEHPAVLRALGAVAAELARHAGGLESTVAVQCRLLAFWELLAVAQPLGRWIRYGMQGGEPLVSAAFLRACATARVRAGGRPRFVFQPDELAAHALGFERMMAHRRLH